MEKITAPLGVWTVSIWEFESGWGSREDEIIVFGPSAEDQKIASNWATAYNKRHNTAAVAPEWYMVAKQPVFMSPAPTGSKVTGYSKT